MRRSLNADRLYAATAILAQRLAGARYVRLLAYAVFGADGVPSIKKKHRYLLLLPTNGVCYLYLTHAPCRMCALHSSSAS